MGAWTEDRVELLRQMWTDGRSAGRISAVLACGLTRNAVVGKVHRLGLAGRDKNSSPAATGSSGTPRVMPPRRMDPQSSRPALRQTVDEWIAAGFTAEDRTAALAAEDKKRAARIAMRARGGHSLSPADKGLKEDIQAPKPLRADPIAERLLKPSLPPRKPDIVRVTIGELKDSMCKWPLGDPLDFENFRYCGSPAPGDGPYCSHHAKLSYQPLQDRCRWDKRLLVQPR